MQGTLGKGDGEPDIGIILLGDRGLVFDLADIDLNVEYFLSSGNRSTGADDRTWMRRSNASFCSGPHKKGVQPQMSQKSGLAIPKQPGIKRR